MCLDRVTRDERTDHRFRMGRKRTVNDGPGQVVLLSQGGNQGFESPMRYQSILNLRGPQTAPVDLFTRLNNSVPNGVPNFQRLRETCVRRR
jgi:hypothetical protein